MESKYDLNSLEYLSKQIFWYAVICFFEEDFNPLNWTILNNFFMIVVYVFFQLYILGSCLTEKNKEENGN
jgi:hypothetical protein